MLFAFDFVPQPAANNARAASSSKQMMREEPAPSRGCRSVRPFMLLLLRGFRCHVRINLFQPTVLGSSASRMPSPRRLKASTVIRSAAAGKVKYHQAVLKIGVDSAIIWPQLAC